MKTMKLAGVAFVAVMGLALTTMSAGAQGEPTVDNDGGALGLGGGAFALRGNLSAGGSAGASGDYS